MNELRGCQKYSMGPNFIYFGAQKYGYRPIPSEIETEELMKVDEPLKLTLVQLTAVLLGAKMRRVKGEGPREAD